MGTPIDVEILSESGPDGQWAVITVSKEGEGVSPEILPRLFSRLVADSKSTDVGLDSADQHTRGTASSG